MRLLCSSRYVCQACTLQKHRSRSLRVGAGAEGVDSALGECVRSCHTGYMSWQQAARLSVTRGSRVGPYEVLDELGRGGMGAVYRARDHHSGRHVALKVVLGDAQSPERLARLEREGDLTAALDHPGIVKIHAAGHHAGRPYLAYELIENARDWHDVVTAIPLDQRVELVRDAARALGAAHARGIVHRDVKPDNLLIDGDGRVRVADFGLAYAEDLERLTKTGALVGTPYYMSPEQFDPRACAPCGPPADVWSLGVLLYQTITGELPFAGSNVFELAAAIQRGSPLPPRSQSAEVSVALETVCLRALAADLDRRYADGEELAEDLDRVLRGETVETRGFSHLAASWRRSWAWIAAPAVAAVCVLFALLYQPERSVALAPKPEERPAKTVAHAGAADPQPSTVAKPSEPGVGKLPVEPSEVEKMTKGIGELLDASITDNKDPAVNAYLRGRFSKNLDPALAAEHFHQAAKLGHVVAARLYGEYLLKGESIPEDRGEAFRWFKIAAEGGDSTALRWVGSMLLEGRGPDQDPKAAYGWLLRAAQAGDKNAMRQVADEYKRGRYLKRSRAEAKAWRRRSKERH
jgi:serine/threonine protein kinase